MDNYKLTIRHDAITENPFMEWGNMPLLLVESIGRHKTLEDYKYEDILYLIGETANDLDLEEIKELCDLLNYDYEGEVDEIDLEGVQDFFYREFGYCFKEFEIALGYLKIPYITHSSRGFSQGDYADIILVFDNEVDSSTSDLVELFDSWAWGKTYSYLIEEKVSFKKVYPDGKEVESFEWVYKDSCGGFFGDNMDKNGMKDNVPEELHYLFDDFDWSDVEY